MSLSHPDGQKKGTSGFHRVFTEIGSESPDNATWTEPTDSTSEAPETGQSRGRLRTQHSPHQAPFAIAFCAEPAAKGLVIISKRESKRAMLICDDPYLSAYEDRASNLQLAVQ